jgi:polyferredoxin
MNATESKQRYTVTVEGIAGIKLASETEIEVLPTEVRGMAVRVQVPPDAIQPGSHPIHFGIKATGANAHGVDEKAVFIVPR